MAGIHGDSKAYIGICRISVWVVEPGYGPTS